ncbi:MAG: stress responsive protein [SAR86 cluster bacterium]|uniref:Stress responsive protein n=1 Tax=SAR86 cluster bacterium TaxID=2030880 RepID=A0A2A5C7D0_9GAMM|nr:MAG: stress responsive protein [SAR86 cluster bacterium]
MIKHIVCWKVDKPSLSKQYCENAAALLQQMREQITGLITLEVNADTSRADKSADIVLYSEFENWDALAHYNQHPLHLDFKDYLGPYVTERRMADYEI